MTALYVCLLIGLLFALGLPFTRFLPPRDTLQKWVAAPIFGLTAGILVTNMLAEAGLIGKTIAAITLSLAALLAILEVLLSWRSTAERKDQPPLTWRGILPLGIILLACGLVISPLLIKGVSSYWGFANPDQPFYMSIFDYLFNRPFGTPSAAEIGGVYPRYVPSSSAILGLSYLSSILSLLTPLPPSDCFDILCAGVYLLIPLSVFYLSRYGLMFSPRRTLATTAAAVTSSLAVNTFYLDSLGALTVPVFLAIALALFLQYERPPTFQLALLIAGVLSASYFCYYPGFAVTVVALGAAATVALVKRRTPIHYLLLIVISTLALIALTSTPQALAVGRSLVQESVSRRLAATSGNETLMFYALALTEELLPFLWGLEMPGSSVVLPSFANAAFYILFGIGVLLTAVLLLSIRKRISGLPLEFSAATLALLSILCAYLVTKNGYGVFKLVAYIHPILLVAFCGSCFGLWAFASKHRRRLARMIPLLAFASYVSLNSWQSALLVASVYRPSGMTHHRSTAQLIAGYHSAPQFPYDKIRDLRPLDARLPGRTVSVGVPDPVLQRWIAPFMDKSNLRYFPIVSLFVNDSDSPDARTNLKTALAGPPAAYMLTADDIVAPPACEPLWTNGYFRLLDMRNCRDVTVLGAGWYRFEGNPNSPYLWQRRLRWLRKRGAVLALKSGDRPQQLLFSAAAGYGLAKQTRTIRVYVNGHQLQEIEVDGFGQYLTDPFRTPDGWAHLEFEVVEDAMPISRGHAFWFPWVPRDPRRTNVAFASIKILDAGTPILPPVQELDFTDQRTFRTVLSNGLLPDQWIGDHATITFHPRAAFHSVRVEGSAPKVKGFHFPCALDFSWDGRPAGRLLVPAAGPFDLNAELPATSVLDGARHTLEIKPGCTFIPAQEHISADTRTLSFQLKSLRFR